jgi:hypothetical protein
LDEKELNQNVRSLLKRNWMKSVAGLYIPLKKPSDTLNRRPEFKVSGFKVALSPKMQLQV